MYFLDYDVVIYKNSHKRAWKLNFKIEVIERYKPWKFSCHLCVTEDLSSFMAFVCGDGLACWRVGVTNYLGKTHKTISKAYFNKNGSTTNFI